MLSYRCQFYVNLQSLKSLALKALAPHGALEDLNSPFFGLWMSLRGKKTGSPMGAADVVTSDFPKRAIVVLFLRPSNASAQEWNDISFMISASVAVVVATGL